MSKRERCLPPRGSSRRILRRLFDVSSAFSFLLCVAIGTCWVRGYIARDAQRWVGVNRASGDTRISCLTVESNRGKLTLMFVRYDWDNGPWPRQWLGSEAGMLHYLGNDAGWRTTEPSDSYDVGLSGLFYMNETLPVRSSRSFSRMLIVCIADWLALLLAAILPVCWLRANRRGVARRSSASPTTTVRGEGAGAAGASERSASGNCDSRGALRGSDS